MSYGLDLERCRNLDIALRTEWLLTNGLGGFAMGTVSGVNTRRYHGHLVAAVNPPADRMLLLAGLEASVTVDSEPIWISSNQYPGAIYPDGYRHLHRFEAGESVIWRYQVGRATLEKRLTLHRGQNAVTIAYRNTGTTPFLLQVRPLVAHRSYHANFHEHPGYPEKLELPPGVTAVSNGGVRLVLSHPEAQRLPVQGWYYRFEHQREAERGLDPRDDLYCPCELRYDLVPGGEALITASVGEVLAPVIPTEPESAVPHSLGDQLRTAARHYLLDQGPRPTIIAGYPWFTDWGRDTMIALPGICLHTGNVRAARQILTGYAGAMRHGLIPNRFVETGEPEYNTADATLWFANAAYKTLLAEWDAEFALTMLKALRELVEWHQKGTLYGIKVDPKDGLLSQGAAGVQLTWMDAKIGDWVVTPRHGKPVEINGLWVNALRVTEWLAERLEHPTLSYREMAEQAEASFGERFWCPMREHYFDTVDPEDASLRPNQLVAMALPFGPARDARAVQALRTIERELLTPVGLRTLGPEEPSYRGRFRGPLRELDAAYHQGTVWPWLIGPYVSALVRLTGDRKSARQALTRAKAMLADLGLGGIAECYDGDPPQEPNGCPFQAWSVGEILRAWVEDVGGD